MLLTIIGLAVVVTMMVTAKVEQQEALYKSAQKDTSAQISQNAPVIVAKDTIAAGTTIEKSMVEQVRKSEKDIFEDALTTVPHAVGRKVKNEIPSGTQIRESDLE